MRLVVWPRYSASHFWAVAKKRAYVRVVENPNELQKKSVTISRLLDSRRDRKKT